MLRKTMPFAGILGRICDHPCELRCKRRECGEAIRIGALERACVQTPAPEHRSYCSRDEIGPSPSWAAA